MRADGAILSRLVVALAAILAALAWLAVNGVPDDGGREAERPNRPGAVKERLDADRWLAEAEKVLDHVERELTEGRASALRRDLIADAGKLRRDLEELAREASGEISRERLEEQADRLLQLAQAGSEETAERLRPIIAELRQRLRSIEADDPPVKE